MNIHGSLHQIMSHGDKVADLFYLVFLERFPEVQEKFRGVDMKRQTVLLTMALMVIERHHECRYAATKAYLKMLGKQHKDRGIGTELFPKWRNALLESLARFHSMDWNQTLAEQWREAIDEASEIMLSA